MLGALVSKDQYSFVSQGNVKFREISLTTLECNLAGFYLILPKSQILSTRCNFKCRLISSLVKLKTYTDQMLNQLRQSRTHAMPSLSLHAASGTYVQIHLRKKIPVSYVIISLIGEK